MEAIIKDQHKHLWNQGIPDELEFWNSWFAQHGREWPEDYKSRFDVTTPLNSNVLTCALDCQKPVVQILEVGCGPVTSMGYSLPKNSPVKINVVYSDPLATEYAELFAKYQIDRPHPILQMSAENICRHFTPHSFDIVVATNCLDHGYAPPAALADIGWVIKPGGFFCFHHVVNAAVREDHKGLHQWDFDLEDGKLQLSNSHGNRWSVANLLNMRPLSVESAGDWITATFKK